MSATEPDPATLRSRTIGTVLAEASDTEIAVEHVYFPEGQITCDGCGSGHDPGMVGMIIDGGEENNASLLLTPEEALLLANRLTRGANLVLESAEQPADIERDIARLAAAKEETQ